MVKKKLRFLPLIKVIAVLIAVLVVIGGYPNGLNPASAAGSTVNLSGYMVKWGDTLFKIGNWYGVSVDVLKTANSLKSDMIISGQILKIPTVRVKPLKDILDSRGIAYPYSGLEIVVDKSDKALSVLSNGTWLKSFHVELGDGGTGDKQIAGDHKTPEGTFYISEKSVLSPADEYLGTRWMRLSYPNAEDADRGLQQRMIDTKTHDSITNAFKNTWITPQNTALGGGIGIHGGSVPEFGSNWTWGCVGLTNSDVQDFYDYVRVGTRVTIQK